MNKNELLRRPPMTHGATTAPSYYDFDTLIVHHDERVWSSNQKWILTSALAHEGLHWNQHHGTTVGAFLSGIRFAQEDLLEYLATALTPEEREQLGRWQSAGNAVIRIDSTTGELVEPDIDNDKVSAVCELWFKLQQVHALFLDEDVLTGATLNAFDLAHAILSVRNTYTAMQLGHYPSQSLSEIDLFARAMTGELRSGRSSDGCQITVRSLLEAACLVAEAHHLRVDTWYTGGELLFDQDAVTELDGRLLVGPTARVIADFNERVNAAGFLETREQDFIRTLVLLIHVALNPPIPPYLEVDAEAPSTFDWEEVHPVARYFKLINAIILFGPYRGELDTRTMNKYIDDASVAIGCPPISRYRHQLSDWEELTEEELLSNSASSIHPEITELPGGFYWDAHRHYVILCQRNFWRHRSTMLPYTLFGLSARYSAEINHTHHQDLDPGKLWSEPLLWTNGEYALHSSHQNLALNVLAAAAASWASWAVMCSTTFDLSPFPAAARWAAVAALRSLLAPFAPKKSKSKSPYMPGSLKFDSVPQATVGDQK